jgi:hypothetical protein
MSNQSINISGVGGDVIGVGVSGTGNIVGRHVNAASGLQLSPALLARLPGEYASSLTAFSTAVNRQLADKNIPAEQVIPVQKEVEALVKDVEEIQADKPIPIIKKAGITTRLAAIAKGLLKILPQTAETVATFTPLAPFSKLIGTGVDEVIKAVQEEG